MADKATLVAAGALVVALATSGCTGAGLGSSGGAPGGGPLVMPDPFAGIMAPAKRPTYFTVDGCLSQDSGDQVEVLQVEGLDAWSDAELTWKVAWPESGDTTLPGSGVGSAPDTFEALPSQGYATSCTSGETSPVLAVELPFAATEHVGFDSLRVRYKVGDDEYETTYDTQVGICALAGGGDRPSACAEPDGR